MTLTQTAHMFKITSRIIGAALAIFIAARISFLVYNLIFPETPPPTPTPATNPIYGQLPALKLNRVKIKLASNYSTKLDLVTAQLPPQPEVAPVFPVLTRPYSFLSSDRAQAIAASFGLTEQPIKLNTVESVWTAPNVSLQINEQSLNFFYQFNYSADPAVFVTGNLVSQRSIINWSRELMMKHTLIENNQLPDGFTEENQKVYFLNYQNKQLQPVQKVSEANAARIDFERNDISFGNNSYPLLPPKYLGSVTYILLSAPTQGSYKTLEFNFTQWRYAPEPTAIYPLISSSIAWDNLQRNPPIFTVYAGNLELGPMDRTTTTPTIQNLTAKKVFFAYMDIDTVQDFIQPIWVFVGKASLVQGGEIDWVAYVPAVHPDWVISSSTHDTSPLLSPTESPTQ